MMKFKIEQRVKLLMIGAIVSALLILMIWLLCRQNEVIMHEQAHVQICRYLQGNATVAYGRNIFGLYDSGNTTCVGDPQITWHDKAIMDGVNEATSYPTTAVLDMIAGCAEVMVLTAYLIGLAVLWGNDEIGDEKDG